MRQLTDFPLPSGLPEPIDDGAADHLRHMPMPHISLRSTSGKMVDLADLSAPRTVIYCYPMTGAPGKPLPEGWDMIPGARGGTPQALVSGITIFYPVFSPNDSADQVLRWLRSNQLPN
jgi:hypothetical protein